MSELRENLVLQVWDFGDSLDDKVDVGEIFQLGARHQALANYCSIFFGDASLSYIFLEQLVGELEALIDGGLRVVDQSHGN